VTATIRDVAEKAGVTVGTVSRALNGYTDVSPLTRERIIAIASELGYSPNLSARNLSAKSQTNIGLIVSRPEEDSSGINDFFAQLMEGFYRFMDEKSLPLVMYFMDSDMQREKSFDQFCAERNLSGAVVYGLKTTDAYTRGLIDSQTFCVTIDIMIRSRRVGCVSTDNVEGFRETTQYLFDNGHRDILVLAGRKSAMVTLERMKGAYLAFKENGAKLPQGGILYCDFKEEIAYEETKRYLRERGARGATALLCMSDLLAIGAMRAIKEAGLRVPDDLSVIGYDGLPLTKYIDPPLTTLDPNTKNKGYIAIQHLMEIIQKPNNARRINLPHKLTIRGSVKDIRRAGL
jgi:LacI family transcriptional regulator